MMNPFINIHTHKSDKEHLFILNIHSDGTLPLCKHFSYGIHPWDIDKININTQIETIKNLCSEKKLIAIGEIGLDRAIHASLEIQKNVFEKQLEIARLYQLPVIIHCVKAWSDVLSIRKAGKYANAWIFHGFIGNLQTANQIIKAGCYLSFGKALMKNHKIQDVFKQINKESIFLETDDSDVKIEEIYQKAAEIYDICIDDLKELVFTNFKRVFVNLSGY